MIPSLHQTRGGLSPRRDSVFAVCWDGIDDTGAVGIEHSLVIVDVIE